MYLCRPRAISSVGLEHRLDRAGVTGSNPVLPTKKKKNPSIYWGFLVLVSNLVSIKSTC
jgi:hypothetical protein